MGVYLCLGQHPHGLRHSDSIKFEDLINFTAIQDYIKENDKIYVFFAESKHKIKKKAEQCSCQKAIEQVKDNK